MVELVKDSHSSTLVPHSQVMSTGQCLSAGNGGKVVAIPKSGAGQFEIKDSDALQKYQSFHTALSVKLEDDEVMAIAKEAGWETAVRSNGAFSVVEVWIENRLLLEVLSPTQAENYLRAMT